MVVAATILKVSLMALGDYNSQQFFVFLRKYEKKGQSANQDSNQQFNP